MVSHQASSALVPSMSALHDPALGMHDEALGNDLRPQVLLRVLPSAGATVAGVAHHLHADAVGLFDGLGAFAAVGCGRGVELLQAGNLGAGLRDHFSCRVAVLHARRGDRDGQQQTQGVDHQMPFAPLDLLAPHRSRCCRPGQCCACSVRR